MTSRGRTRPHHPLTLLASLRCDPLPAFDTPSPLPHGSCTTFPPAAITLDLLPTPCPCPPAPPSAPTLFIAIGGGGFIPARILRTFCKVDEKGQKRNIPIQAVGLVLYESMGGVSSYPWMDRSDHTLIADCRKGRHRGGPNPMARFLHGVYEDPRWCQSWTAPLTGQLGTNLTHGGLLGRKILIVDEVDDTRTTLQWVIPPSHTSAMPELTNPRYTVKELQKDTNAQLEAVQDEAERERLRSETKLGIFVVHNK